MIFLSNYHCKKCFCNVDKLIKILRKFINHQDKYNIKIKTIPQIQPAKLAHSPFARVF